MRKISREALTILERINPYTGQRPEKDSYIELFDAMRTLRNFGLIPENDYLKIWNFDHKAWTESEQ